VASNQRTRLPTMEEAVDIIAMQISRREQQRQLNYMKQTQGEEFAQKVHDKAKAQGKLRKLPEGE